MICRTAQMLALRQHFIEIPAGAAAGCNLLILFLKIKRSQPAAAPTTSPIGSIHFAEA
jgi:hypothetical protein